MHLRATLGFKEKARGMKRIRKGREREREEKVQGSFERMLRKNT
jgi:hypothetical protein